ncbi:MAG: zf-HC2 domain-containing protein [Planctomycetales bacterium]|nr:zf-HC2 domain-containing protein [Planctomycetales bacterium]
MTCAELSPLLAAHADGELPSIERAAAVAHLQKCPDCSARGEQVRRTVGRLEAALSGYRVPGRVAEACLPLALRSLGRTGPWYVSPGFQVALALLAPALIAVAMNASLRGTAAAWGYVGTWRARDLDAAQVVAGFAVPAVAAALWAVAWARSRRAGRSGRVEVVLYGLATAASSFLAWFGALVSFFGWRDLGMYGRSYAYGLPYGATPPWFPVLELSQTIFPVISALLLVCAAARVGSFALAPAPPAETAALSERERGRGAAGRRLVSGLHLLALSAFEATGDLFESSRLAEEALGAVARALGAAPQDGPFFRKWVGERLREVAPHTADGPVDRPTLQLKKVAERRGLEAALHGLPPDPRAAAYLRLVQGLRAEETEKLLSLPRAALALSFGAAVAALAPALPAEA